MDTSDVSNNIGSITDMSSITNKTNIKIPTKKTTSFINNLFSPKSSSSSNSSQPVITETSPYNVSKNKLEASLNYNNSNSSLKDNNSNSSDKGFLSNIFELFQKTYFKILLLILILAFLGFNLFKYLANATDKTTNILKNPIKKFLSLIGYSVGETTKNIINTSAKGAEVGIDVAAGASDDVVDLGEKALGTENINTDLDSAINKPRKKNVPPSNIPEPDDSGSKTQSSKSTAKSGFCYIGEDRGFRSCIKVQDTNTCMSGEIFPTHDICVNPTLRE